MRLLVKVSLCSLLVLSICLSGCSDTKVVAPDKSKFKVTDEKSGASVNMKVPPPPNK